jgi:hypothetical protein
VSPRVPQFQARLLVWEGSGVATCHMAHDMLWATRKREILNQSTYSLGPPTSEACLCVLEMPDIRLIMTSPGTWSRQHIKCVQDSHMGHMDSIKYVQDIDTTR